MAVPFKSVPNCGLYLSQIDIILFPRVLILIEINPISKHKDCLITIETICLVCVYTSYSIWIPSIYRDYHLACFNVIPHKFPLILDLTRCSYVLLFIHLSHTVVIPLGQIENELSNDNGP